MANEMIYSNRKGKLSGLRKWMSRIASAQITVLPVPGEEVFRSQGIHLPQLGYDIAANPRQANAMMLTGPVNEHLAKKAAVAYVQMPRPRVLVFVNSGPLNHLPTPDFQIQMKEQDFIQLKSKVRNFLSNPYQPEAEALEISFIKEMLEEQENQQQDHEHHQHHHGHGGDGHQHGEGKGEHEQEQHEHDHEEREGHEEHQGHEGHGGHEHEHGGHGGGFMSMVMMTKDIPRSMDGLPMEHNQAWFGPFFPGLTGELAFQMMLDGDTVMQVQANKELWQRNRDDLCGIPVEDLPEKLMAMNPLAPNAYRILAEAALVKLNGEELGVKHAIESLKFLKSIK